jgi:hypothetical protein
MRVRGVGRGAVGAEIKLHSSPPLVILVPDIHFIGLRCREVPVIQGASQAG